MSRPAKLDFGPVESLPICCLFYKDELRFVDDFKKKHPELEIPCWRERNIIAVCATHPIDKVLELKRKRVWYFGRDYAKIGLTEENITTFGEHHDALQRMHPEFHDEFAAANRKWCAGTTPLDQLIILNPSASIYDLMDGARELGMENHKRTEDAVRNRRTVIHKACIRYEEERLREMVGIHRIKPNEVCCQLVYFGDDLAAILTESSKVEDLLTPSAWKKWPLSQRLLTNTFTYGAIAKLKPDLRDVRIQWAVTPTGKIISDGQLPEGAHVVKSFRAKT